MPSASKGEREDAESPTDPFHDHVWRKIYDDDDRVIEYRCDLCPAVWQLGD